MARVDLGERIATLREEQALTQAELAERARISPSTLSLIESGRVPRPHVGTIRKIARALGVEPQDFRRVEELAHPLAEAPPSGPAYELVGLEGARKSRGMSLAELATKAGIPVAEVAALEEGTEKAGDDRLRRLVAALGDCYRAELIFPREQFEAFLAEAGRNAEVVLEDLSEVDPVTALAIRRSRKRIVDALNANNEQRRRDQPAAG